MREYTHTHTHTHRRFNRYYAKLKTKNVGADDSVRPQRKRNTLLNQTGITLVALVISIIVIIILAAVSINIMQKLGIINKAQTAVTLYEIENIKEQIEIHSIDKKLTGKISELGLNFDENIVNKYDDILYIKDSKIYLDFMANNENSEIYNNNKETIETLKKKIDICYDSIKKYNKILNPSFDKGLNNYYVAKNKNVIEVLNENGNNYVHMELYKDSGNTAYIIQKCAVAQNYEEKIYCFVRFRNNYIESEEGNQINTTIVTIEREYGGYATGLINKNRFINAYNKGWQNVSAIRTTQERYGVDGLIGKLRLGGNETNLSSWQYSIDFDDLYIINLTEIFGKGNEPSKEEMDKIFSGFWKE